MPRQILHGLLTAQHAQLHHPSSRQLKSIVHRYFFALDIDKSIDTSTIQLQSSSEPKDALGFSFAADVINRNRQLILVLWETATSLTTTCLIEEQRHNTLRDPLISLCIGLRPVDGPMAVIGTDPAPGFKSLVNDKLL